MNFSGIWERKKLSAERAGSAAALALMFLLITGCAGVYRARVRHEFPSSARPAETLKAASSLFVVLNAARPGPGETAPVFFDSAALAAGTAAAIDKSPRASVCAWRVVYDAPPDDLFAGGLNPAGVLEISVGRPAVFREKREREVTYEREITHDDRRQRARTGRETVYVYGALVKASAVLRSWPGGREIDSWSGELARTEERRDESMSETEWFYGGAGIMAAELAEILKGRYAGAPVFRTRPVAALKGDSESEEALSLARRGRWGDASAIWEKRSSEGGWRDYFGLAVAEEISGHYAAAEELYSKAKAAAEGDPEAARVNWDSIENDLSLAAVAASSGGGGCQSDWFGRRTALLPASDSTNSIDGPPLVRRLLWKRLAKAGYNMQPADETDEILRKHGYSEGGQLRAADPGELAFWLGVERLLYLDIEDFGEIMAGVYNRREAAGSLKLLEPGGEEILQAARVINVSSPKSLVKGLVSQLARGLTERIAGQPLAAEAEELSVRLSALLPNSCAGTE